VKLIASQDVIAVCADEEARRAISWPCEAAGCSK